MLATNLTREEKTFKAHSRDENKKKKVKERGRERCDENGQRVAKLPFLVKGKGGGRRRRRDLGNKRKRGGHGGR